ncbi:MAG: choice-of-anchor J domain-containing protein [Prevotella sp.]|uniref:choice-of-anchor J domain-containing protein n=1 Tax=Prevotella sp. TaxID=59823 RepID=UPI002A278285|nr:choice-of-anchor J domain-containing protein [Prevotella sp.]MDD7318622.1 choice-of-anchor J domain-containing protein [Prevotellaceae bacterium]MDY4019422.1 choice-of-anchor J domain-containing protein [Prevotella sp.]
MSKKLTSLMVIAAAGLLTLPAMAQTRGPVKAAQNLGTTMKTTTSRVNYGNLAKDNVLIKALEAGVTDRAELERIWNENISTPATTVRNNIRKASKVDALPYNNNFSTEALFNDLTVIDANADNTTWVYVPTGWARCKYSTTAAADDWLVTPGIKLEANKAYDFTVEIKAELPAFPERFEVKMVKAADTPDAATISGGTVVIGPKDVTHKDFQPYTKEAILVAETGYYYFGVHGISDKNQFYLSAKNITVKESAISTESPVAPTLEVTAAPLGELKGIVKVTAPTKNIGGADLGTNISKVVLYRDDAVIKTFEGVTKGQVLNFDDTEGMTHGMHSYYAVPFGADGKEGIKSDKVSVYIGSDIPVLPEELNIKDPGALVMSWALVSEGVNNGYVNPATVDYNLHEIVYTDFYGMKIPTLGNKIATVRNQNTYEYNGINPDEGEQDFLPFGLQPSNEAGPNPSFTYGSVFIGKPYDLPFVEGFADKKLHSAWYGDSDISALGLSTEATDGDGVALDFQMSEYAKQPGEGYLSTGKLNLNSAANPTLLFDAKKGSAGANLAIYGSKNGEEPVKLQDIALTDQYKKFEINLTSLKGGRYAQVRFVSNFTSKEDHVIIDNIMVRDYYTDDLAVTMAAPASVNAGEKANVEVTVENNGSAVCNSYTVNFYANGNKIKTETVNEPLSSFAKKVINFEYETTIFDEGEVALKAEVSTEVDLNMDNNIAEITLPIKQPNVPAPTNLNAVENNGRVTLTWDAPNNTAAAEVTETFDDETVFAPFSIGGLSKDVHSGSIGDWTLYDGNAMYVYGFQNLQFDNAGIPQAWQVFNPDAVNPNWAGMAPRSGKQYMLSFCPAEENNTPNADHWLISPALSGNAQTISFYGKQISTTDQNAQGFYGFEKFEVLSTTSGNATDVAGFTKVGDGEISQADWAEFTFNLPEGATNFAIRHTSKDVFGLMVDDVKYSVGGGAEVASYNIYIDGELYKNVSGDQLTTIIGDLADGSHTFAVTAVYTNGKESKPVTFVLATTGIEAVSVDGKPVDIYTIDGKLVRKQATSLEGLNGLYIINNQKVIIR